MVAGRSLMIGANSTADDTASPIRLDRLRGERPPVDGVACDTAFLTLEVGLASYDRHTTRTPRRAGGELSAS